MTRYDADWIDYMLRPERRSAPPAEETVATLGVTRGQTIVDVGCGPGFFTLPVARIVAPDGLVYAIDVEPSMLDLVTSRAAAAGISGIETLRAAPDCLPLADAVADLTICGLVLHDLEDRLGMTRELIRVTRRGGRIAVVEWRPEPDDRRGNRMQPEEIQTLFQGEGWEVSTVAPVGSGQYLIVVG